MRVPCRLFSSRLEESQDYFPICWRIVSAGADFQAVEEQRPVRTTMSAAAVAAVDAERHELIRLWRENAIGDEVMRHQEELLDYQEAQL